ARFIRGQTLTLLEKLNELDADEQADICESLHDHADELYRSCLTRGIDALYHAGEIKGRQDVIQALTEAGLEVVRVTRSSISIA
ncbi:Rop family plasmid primer RNA-binding protein, partial [Escherichia coli]|uniref:Rop family plasmid primer RNA-binding protein n=1 Tax=Escherichia coli TaxID=562 RepID=UPI003EE2AECA